MAAVDTFQPTGPAAKTQAGDAATWPIAAGFLVLGALLRYVGYAVMSPHADAAGFAQAYAHAA